MSVTTSQPVIVYDYEKCIEIIMGWDGIEDDIEAMDYFHFNVAGTNLKDKTPIFIRKHDSVADIEDYSLFKTIRTKHFYSPLMYLIIF